MDSYFYEQQGNGYTPYYVGGYGGFGRAPVLELMVPMCCVKCEEKAYEEMMELRGVQGVFVDRDMQRVIVHGYVDPMKALRRARRVKPFAQIWGGDHYGSDFLSSSKYRRSSYRSPALYRSSSLEYHPSMYRAPLYEHSQPVYRSSYNRYTPSYRSSYVSPYGSSYLSPYGSSYLSPYGSSYRSSYGGLYEPWSPFDDLYSPYFTNPYYVQHPESEYY